MSESKILREGLEPLKTEFCLEGEFLGLIAVDCYKLKYLSLRTATTDFVIKVPKEYRGEIVHKFSKGDRIQVWGIQTEAKLKAFAIEKIVSLVKLPHISLVSLPTPNLAKQENSQLKILVCKKSDCCNRGAREIYAHLEQELANRDLGDRITLKSTGCLKQCKQAPNIIVLPDNSKIGRVKLSQVAQIVDRLEQLVSTKSQNL